MKMSVEKTKPSMAERTFRVVNVIIGIALVLVAVNHIGNFGANAFTLLGIAVALIFLGLALRAVLLR